MTVFYAVTIAPALVKHSSSVGGSIFNSDARRPYWSVRQF